MDTSAAQMLATTTKIDLPGSVYTYAYGINAGGEIASYFVSASTGVFSG
jgi:hypothetical protein